ncbi:MAG TPA: TonB-dependent receptor, partial [Vicinamibacterales bacterium]|nr:TonB-dependent receptor [Vicinamibacterales bacterium]
ESRVTVSDAVVTAANNAGVIRTASTDAAGRFTLVGLPVGTYAIAVEHPGFAKLDATNVELALGGVSGLELLLTTGRFEDTVTVVAPAPLTLPANAALAMVVPQQRIDTLPTNGRNFIAFSLLTPGVNADQTPQQGATRTSGLTFAGQRARSNNITVDGLDNNDETVGSVRALFSQEAVAEFQVLTSAYTAEFGKASGGVVNIVTKSGSNTVNGDAFGFFRGRVLDSRGYFELFSPDGQPIDQPKAPFNQQQLGGIVGGPLKKDVAFYFLSFEHLGSHASNLVTIDDQTLVSSPLNPAVVLGTPLQILQNAGFQVPNGAVPYTIALNQFLAKTDVRAGKAHMLSVRVNTATELNEDIYPFGGEIARSAGAALESTDVAGAFADNVVLSSRASNEVRAQIAVRNQLVRSLDPSCVGSCLDESQGGPALAVTGVATVGRQRFTPTFRDNVRYQMVDTANYYRGNHQLKAGFDGSYIEGRRQSLPLYFGGQFVFQGISLPIGPAAALVPVSAIQEVALGLPLAYVQGYGNSGAAYDVADAALFAQDEWRLTPTTSVNLGVRYQKQFWPSASYQPAGYPGTYGFPADRGSVAPRLAVAWRPASGRAIAVRAAWGMYYDNIITSVFGITDYVNGTDGVRTLALLAPGSFAAWAAPAHHLSEAAALQLTGGSYPSVAITIDPALKTPYAHHLVAGVTSEIRGRMTLSADAIYVRGFNQLGTIDYNPLVPQLGPGRRPADVNGRAGTSASVLQYTSFGETWYRGVVVSLDKRFNGRFQTLVSYTLSKADDNSTDFQSAFLPQNSGFGRNPADPNGLPLGFNPDDERGPSVQDQRHRLVVSGAYESPGGVQLSAILNVGSGRPFNILAGADLNGDGDGGGPPTDRARRVPSDPTTSVGRNSGTLPAQATLDVRVTRVIRTRGAFTLQPMFEAFNLFNRTNFTDIQNVFGTGAYPTNPLPTYGQFTQAGPPRQIQLSLKVSF